MNLFSSLSSNSSQSDSTSASSSKASAAAQSSQDNFVFDLKAYYKPLRIGTLSKKTRLEEILSLLNLPFEDYIWYSDV